MANLNDYHLEGKLGQKNVIVGNLCYDDLGKLVLGKLNEQFKGVPNIEDTKRYNKGDPINNSNTPKALAINQILLNETHGEMRILSLYNVVELWDVIDKGDTNADTNAVSISKYNSNPITTHNSMLMEKVLSMLGKNPKYVNYPLVVENLGVEKDATNTRYGYTFTETPYLKCIELPFLDKHKDIIKVSYTPQGLKDVSKALRGGVHIYTHHVNVSGLFVVNRNTHVIQTCSPEINMSDANGRIQIIQMR